MGGKRCAGLGLLLVPTVLLGAATAIAQTKPAPPANDGPAPAIFVLDGSQSMWARLGGQRKVPLARSAIVQALTDYKDRIAFGFVAFGHRRAKPCADSQLRAKAGELTSDNQGKFLLGFKPISSKPIAAAFDEAVKGATQASGSLDIVLITDGVDSCKADVCAKAQSLKKSTPDLRIHVIGFDAKAKQTVKPLRCVAQNTGGQFLIATKASELKQNLTAILDTVVKPAAETAPVAQNEGDNGQAPQAGTAEATPPLPVRAPPEVATRSPSEATPATEQKQAASPQDIQAQAPPAQGEQAPGPEVPQPDIVGPKIPAQTDIPKLARAPTNESAAPPRTKPAAPAGSALPVPVTFKALLTEGGPNITSGLIWRIFSLKAGPNGARKLVSTHREAVPTAALPPGEYLVNAAYGLSNLTKKIKVESGRSVEETFVLNTGGLKLGAVLANGQPLPQTSVHFDILSDEEDQFGNRRKILGNAKPGVVIRLNSKRLSHRQPLWTCQCDGESGCHGRARQDYRGDR